MNNLATVTVDVRQVYDPKGHAWKDKYKELERENALLTGQMEFATLNADGVIKELQAQVERVRGVAKKLRRIIENDSMEVGRSGWAMQQARLDVMKENLARLEKALEDK